MTFSEDIKSRAHAIKREALSKSTSASAWRLEKQTSSLAPEYVWTNSDMDPVPVAQQTWTAWSFVAYWFSDIFTIAGWQTASSALLMGLSTTDAILIALVAGTCNAVPSVLNGAIGSDLHIPFPIAVRASFGYWFNYFAVFSRSVLALFWFGIQGYGGASCVAAMITAIWPSFARLENALPESAGTTTQMMIAYFLYSLIQFPLLLLPTHKVQWLFYAKAIAVPPMVVAMTIWTCLRARGSGAIFNVDATITGSVRAWLWLATMTSVTGGYSTIAVNVPDFSRFSKTKGAQWWQLPIIPFFKVFVSLFGIICTGASKHIWGEFVWNPLTIVSSWGSTPAGRFAAFVAAFIWLIAQLTCNISANSISFANDITTLCPKYFNIKRGVVFAAIFGGWALVPWKILESASNLLSFMAGYAIFLGPYAGIMVCDYWIIRRRRVDVPALYDPKGIYRYNKYGTNWRAALIICTIVAPLLPGLVNAVATGGIGLNTGLRRLYNFSWLFGFFTSIFMYFVLMKVFPARDTLVDTPVLLGSMDVEQNSAEIVYVKDEKSEQNNAL